MEAFTPNAPPGMHSKLSHKQNAPKIRDRLGVPTVQPSYFEELASEAETMSTTLENNDTPHVGKTMSQMIEESQRMWMKATAVEKDEQQEMQATVLLGSVGMELPKLPDTLSQGLQEAQRAQPNIFTNCEHFDLQHFSKMKQRHIMAETASDVYGWLMKSSGTRMDSNWQDHWEGKKTDVLKRMQTSRSLVDRSRSESAAKSIILPMTGGKTDMTPLQGMYSKHVIQYIRDKIDTGVPPFMPEVFLTMCKDNNDQIGERLWIYVVRFLRTVLEFESDEMDLATISHIWKQKCREVTADSRLDLLLKGSIAALEGSFRDELQKVLQNIRNANIRSSSSIQDVVRNYMILYKYPKTVGGLKLESCEIGGLPFWPYLFLLLRCGAYGEVEELCTTAREKLGSINPFLLEYCQQRGMMSRNMQVRMQMLYKTKECKSEDVFRRTCWSLICGHQVHGDSMMVTIGNTEDYMWMKLHQLLQTKTVTGDKEEGMTLGEWQNSLRFIFDKAHLNMVSQHLLYFMVMFLSLQAECGVDYLMHIHNALQTHAVHIAIALQQYDMLLLHEELNDSALSVGNLQSNGDTNDASRSKFNMVRAIQSYTQTFEDTDYTEAVYYFYCLTGLPAGVRYSDGEGEAVNYYMCCIFDFISKNDDGQLIEKVLGKNLEDGCRQMGVVDEFKEDVRPLMNFLGGSFEDRGNFQAAIYMYDLAGNVPKVEAMFASQLVSVVPQAYERSAHRAKLQADGAHLAVRYKRLGINSNGAAFYVLLDLMDVFNLYVDEKYSEALAILTKLSIIPLHLADVQPCVKNFLQLPHEIVCVLHDILIVAMNILVQEYKRAGATYNLLASKPSSWLSQVKGYMFGTEEAQALELLRGQAKAILHYSGHIPIKLPGNTCARLAELETQFSH